MTLLTPEEVADRCRVSRSTVYGWLSRDLTSLRLGSRGRGAIRVRESDLEAFLESRVHRVAAPVDPTPTRRGRPSEESWEEAYRQGRELLARHRSRR